MAVQTLTLAHELRRFIAALESQAAADGLASRISAAVVRN